MKQPIVCPACNATNKPKAVTCRVCGERLVERREKSGGQTPVVLQRVMSGEMFSAVVVPGQEGVRIEKKPRSALDEHPAPAPPEAERDAALTEGEVMRVLRQVLSHSQRGEFQEAIRLADRVLDKRPRDPKALVVKADALFRSGRRKEAVEIFDVLVGIDPENAKLWLDRARIQKSMENYPDALKSYDASIRLDGSIAEAWYERAGVLDALEDMSGAMKSLAKAIELRPEYPQARTLRVDLDGRRAREAVKAVATEIERELVDLESRAVSRAESGLEEGPGHEPEVGAASAEARTERSEAPRPAVARPPEGETIRTPRPKGRLFTYVDGLDEALNGGIPEAHVVILAGPPGTLKSSLCLSVAVSNAARERRPCLYITFEEAKESLLHQARSMGLPLEEAAARMTFLDARDLRASVPPAGEDWVDAFAAVLEAFQSERPFELLVLDALEGLEAVARFRDRRRAIFRLFEHLRALSVTTLVVAERPDIVIHGNVIYGRWAEDFLADGIVHLRQHLVSDVEVQRRIRIVKMRGTRHETGYMALLLDEGRLKATRAMAQ